MSAGVTVGRQFVDVGGRRVHLRHAGCGPAVVLVHQSPQNSRALLPWIEWLADRFAVFAPDTPGFGHSDPLPLADADIGDHAEALAELLGALGLQRVLLCGVHTGAAIATQLALNRPERVAALVTDGLALFDDAERAALLGSYLPPFEPSWDGSHLRWLFARLREQHLFFPWFDGRREARLRYPLPSPERVRDGVLDVLDAGDGYRAAYRAAFRHQPAAALPTLAVPARLCYRAGDVLAAHAARCPPLPVTAQVQAGLDGEAALRRSIDEAFVAAAPAAASVDSTAAVDNATSATRRIVRVGGLEWAFRLALDEGAAGPARLALGDIGHAAVLPAGRAAARLAVDWPGHGASGALPLEAVSMDALAASLHAALQVLPMPGPTLTLQAHGGAALLALKLAQRCGPACSAPDLDAAPPTDAGARRHFLRGLPSLQPDGHGGWLLEAWDWVRLSSLFDPWQPEAAAAGLQRPAPDPWRVHERVRELVRAGPLHAALWRAALEP